MDAVGLNDAERRLFEGQVEKLSELIDRYDAGDQAVVSELHTETMKAFGMFEAVLTLRGLDPHHYRFSVRKGGAWDLEKVGP